MKREKALNACRRLLRAAALRPTETRRRLEVLGRIQDAAARRLRVVPVDGWYRERRPREIAETRGVVLRRYDADRPAVFLPWPALLDAPAPPMADLVERAGDLLREMRDAGNLGLARYGGLPAARLEAPEPKSPDDHTKYCIIRPMIIPKPVEFRSRSLDDLRTFPVSARREAGHQIDRVQHGLEPDDWKPMATVGSGVREIRIRDESGIFRVVYVAKLADAVYVLHCFQKKTRKTDKADIDLAKNRYRDLIKELNP